MSVAATSMHPPEPTICKYYINSLTAGPRYIHGCCLMLERRYGFRAGA